MYSNYISSYDSKKKTIRVFTYAMRDNSISGTYFSIESEFHPHKNGLSFEFEK